MKRIKKYKKESTICCIEERLTGYTQMSRSLRKTTLAGKSPALPGYRTLYSLAALAAASMAPVLTDAQCVVSNYFVDIDGDYLPDIYIYPTFITSGYGNNSVQAYQWRVRASGANTVQFPGSGPGIPRFCYFASCLFPYANGQTAAPALGSVAVLFSSVNTCFRNYVTNTNCYTVTSMYSTTGGGTGTSTFSTCYTSFYTTTNCLPTISNGNFAFNVQGTLAFSLNGGAFQFMELTLGNGANGMLVQTINGQPALDCAVLAVELSSFTVQPKARFIELNWTTDSELKNMGFELQRSTDGKDFRKIAWIPAQGSSEDKTQYSFSDRDVVRQQIYYYRLKQYDTDGNHSFSDIVNASISSGNDILVGELFPNPASEYDQTSLEITATDGQKAIIEIFNTKGARQFNQEFSLVEGLQRLTLSTEGLSNGAYYVKIQFETGDVVYKKLMVVRD